MERRVKNWTNPSRPVREGSRQREGECGRRRGKKENEGKARLKRT